MPWRDVRQDGVLAPDVIEVVRDALFAPCHKSFGNHKVVNIEKAGQLLIGGIAEGQGVVLETVEDDGVLDELQPHRVANQERLGSLVQLSRIVERCAVMAATGSEFWKSLHWPVPASVVLGTEVEFMTRL